MCDIVNELYPFISIAHTTIITSSKPRIDTNSNQLIRTLYIDVDALSWSELSTIILPFPNLTIVIIRVNRLIGGIIKLIDILDKRRFAIFAVIVNGCHSIANPSAFFTEWDRHIIDGSLHIFYHQGPAAWTESNLKLKILTTEPYPVPFRMELPV